MASSKRRTVPLGEEDRRYLAESVSDAKRRGGTAAAGLEESSIFETLESFGLSSARVERLREAIGNIEIREGIEKAQEYLSEQIESAREYARENPKKVYGGAAGVLVGASLLALAIKRASESEKRSRAAAKAGRASAKSPSSPSFSPAKARSSGGGSKKRSSKKSSKKR